MSLPYIVRKRYLPIKRKRNLVLFLYYISVGWSTPIRYKTVPPCPNWCWEVYIFRIPNDLSLLQVMYECNWCHSFLFLNIIEQYF